MGEELETGLPAGAAGFAAREGAIDARNFAKIFFNMTISAQKRLRIARLCNSHMPRSRMKDLESGPKQATPRVLEKFPSPIAALSRLLFRTPLAEINSMNIIRFSVGRRAAPAVFPR